jgi:hypothetical protein
MPSSDRNARDWDRTSLPPCRLAAEGTPRRPLAAPGAASSLSAFSASAAPAVDLELLLGLDADQDRRTTAGDDDLVRVVDRLEDEREGAFELHDDALDERGERDLLALLRVVQVLGEDGGDLGVRVGLELVAALLENETELLVCSGTRCECPVSVLLIRWHDVPVTHSW